MAESTPNAPVPMLFLVVVLAAAVIISAAVIYLGFRGSLGGPIP